MSTKVQYPESYPYNEASKAESTDDECSCESHGSRTYKTNLIKFKTQMCKNYSEMGFCPYRAKCQFAHGPHELVLSAKNSKKAYRTRKCKSFWEEGTCRYGFRCQFLHNDTEVDKQKDFQQMAHNILCLTPSQGKSRLTSIFQSHRN